MKNRIWKKSGAVGMSFLTACMILCSGVGTVSAYASEPSACDEYVYDALIHDEMESSEPVDTEVPELEESDQKETDIILEENEECVSELAGDAENAESSDEDDIQQNDTEQNEDADEKESAENASVSDGNKDENSEKQKKTDLEFSVVTDASSVKAGSDLIYTVTVENTGEVMLKDVQVSYLAMQDSLVGEWSGTQSGELEDAADTVGRTAYIEQLDVGIKRVLYLTVKLPEGQEETVLMKFSASAETDEEESRKIVNETEVSTTVIPLKASFEVTKTADRSMAVPGDKILFQICIRNTGERTLHSVITTERFQMGNVPVQFLEKEGVTLNKAKTKAKIDKIEPGKAAGLEAMVTLPKNIKEQELLNEVTVTTLETGDQTITSQAKIQVKAGQEEDTDSMNMDSVDTGNKAVSHAGESYPVSENPKTGDPYQPFLWLAMIPGSLLAAGWIRSRM